MLTRPGTYKVGGLGACTLIRRHALERGVSFQEIYNLGLTGEDRHFCIRAAALGLELYADTHYPPFHIYRESELDSLTEYKENLACAKPPVAGKSQVQDNSCAGHGGPSVPAAMDGEKVPNQNLHLQLDLPLNDQTKLPTLHTVSPGKITLAMLVRNEAGRHLERVLKQTTAYIDHAVILDDASEDNTVELCQGILQGIPLTLHSNKEPLFHNEILLRRQLWQMAVRTNPEWIVILDADELFEENAPKQLRELLSHSSQVDYLSFRLFDLWTETQYRDDSLWQAHKWYRPFIVRNIPNFQAQWQETPQHCGRFPKNIIDLRGGTSYLRIKHLGWVRPQDRLAKYYRYQKLDPNGTYGNLEQYRSILDPSPNLVAWEND